MNSLAGHSIEKLFWQRLAGLDPETVAVSACVSVTETGCYAVPVLGKTVRVDPARHLVSCNDPDNPLVVDFELCMAVVLYLTGARQMPLSGRWIGPHQLREGHFFKGPHAAPVGPVVNRFGSDKDSFITRGTAVGGKRESFADVSFSFSFFPRIPVSVLLWLADDEFDARASFLIDDTADQHLKPDSILACLNLLQSALTKDPA